MPMPGFNLHDTIAYLKMRFGAAPDLAVEEFDRDTVVIRAKSNVSADTHTIMANLQPRNCFVGWKTNEVPNAVIAWKGKDSLIDELSDYNRPSQ